MSRRRFCCFLFAPMVSKSGHFHVKLGSIDIPSLFNLNSTLCHLNSSATLSSVHVQVWCTLLTFCMTLFLFSIEQITLDQLCELCRVCIYIVGQRIGRFPIGSMDNNRWLVNREIRAIGQPCLFRVIMVYHKRGWASQASKAWDPIWQTGPTKSIGSMDHPIG